MPRVSERKFLAGLYLLILAIGLFLSWPSLSYYWFSDDLQLIRPYSNQELLQAFVGDYDPSNNGTPGWRPLTRVYYHVEATVFGENVELHRLYDIAQFALHVLLLLMIARQLNLSRMTVLVAGIILVCTKNTWWTMVWPTDGLRGFMGIQGSLAIYLLILYLKKPARWKFALALLFYTTALFTREEILFYAAVIPAVATIFLLLRDDVITQPRRWLSVRGLRAVVTYFIMAAAITLAFWIGRSHFVPRTGTVPIQFQGMLFNLFAVLFPRIPAPSILGSAILIGLFWIVLILMLRAIEGRQRMVALFFLGCVVVGCTPGLSSPRANNTLLAIGFFALFVATVFVNFARRSRLAVWVCVLILAGFIGSSAYMHRLAQETIATYSTYYLEGNSVYLYGWFVNTGVPQERLDQLAAEYHAIGIDSKADYDARFDQIVAQIQATGRNHPDGDQLFVPVYPNFLYPW